MREQYLRARDVLREGGLVALPTDTVYGLCAMATDGAAVERLYEVKARDPKQPLPLFVGSVEQARLIVEMNDAAEALAAGFWPGALTIVLRKKPTFETRAAAGGETIGVRVPDDPMLRELASQLGPITGTSANIAGREECHTADEVRAQLGDSVDLIVDAPVAASGTASTIVDSTDPPDVRVLREGAIDSPAIEAAIAGLHGGESVNLTPEEERRITSFFDRPERAGHPAPKLSELRSKWMTFVDDVERGFEGNIYDYTLYLDLRDTLDELCGVLDPTNAVEFARVLERADSKFFSITFPIERPLLRSRVAPWWFHVPKRLRSELRSHLIRRGYIETDGVPRSSS
jgi:L-threonylcarbamoyladenylate synthase